MVESQEPTSTEPLTSAAVGSASGSVLELPGLEVAGPSDTASAVVPQKRRLAARDVPCCGRYEKGKVFKRSGVADDEALQQLLLDTGSMMPAQCKQALCNAGYHCTRHEITNYRERQPTSAREPAVSSEVLLGDFLQVLGDV